MGNLPVSGCSARPGEVLKKPFLECSPARLNEKPESQGPSDAAAENPAELFISGGSHLGSSRDDDALSKDLNRLDPDAHNHGITKPSLTLDLTITTTRGSAYI